MEILDGLQGVDLDAELPLFNKVGDLYQKMGKIPDAADVWERAMNRYSESGFANNAIALCNKILRVAPGRTTIYLKLAQLMVQRGLTSEAKQYFLEYASRMQQAGRLDQAFQALKEFADLSADNADVRLMLAEQLKAAARTTEAREQLSKLYAEAQGDDRRSRATLNQIKEVDPDYNPETEAKAKPAYKSQKTSDLVFLDLGDDAPPSITGPRPAVGNAAPPVAKPRTAPTPPAAPPAPAAPPLRGVGSPPRPKATPPPPPPPEPEPETADLGIERASVEFDTPDDVGQVSGLDTGMGFQSTPSLDTDEDEDEDDDPADDAGFDVPMLDLPEMEMPQIESELDLGASDLAGLSLDVPEIDLSSPAAMTPASKSASLPDGFMGADALDVHYDEDAPVQAPPDIAALQAAVADDPDDPARHRALAEALIENGSREQGLEELDITMSSWEAREEWQSAQDLADEILRLDPNSIRHHQKRVEYAFRLGDKPNLIHAYLELADAFFRSGAMDRARTVYQRVLEHDAGNERAISAISSMDPAPAAAPPSKRTAAPSKMAPVPDGEFVNLGDFIMDEERPKDARLRIQDEEPTGDEERDFKDMLDQFKKGIDATLGDDDSQAHYDLGVAFKEMGLLDEAISEFQKALRSQDMRIRTAEALGVCFFEKGQPEVAATVLRRAIEQDPGSDENKIGLLYWLGRSEEEQGKMAEALNNYQRVFALDIRFQDVNSRVKTLAKAGR
jgi:tetratricopeptide (TPR) repeat protein